MVRPLAKLAALAFVFALLFVSGVARAQALTVVSSSPKEGDVVVAPTKIALTFSAPIDAKGMTAWITDANGTPNANALCPQVTGQVNGAKATLVVPTNALHPGLTVAVLWTAHAKGSSDPPQSGKLTFTLGAAPMLVGSSPSGGGIATTPPETISLSFDTPVATEGASIVVTVESGSAAAKTVAVSAPVASADGKTLTVTIASPPSGTYRVTWSVKSKVGVGTHGMVRFSTP
jgi:methionine-rich copper-binding protein CopC